MKRLILTLILAVICLGTGWTVGGYPIRGIPFVGTEDAWSIGIYAGDSPFNILAPNNSRNPVLTAAHVRDVRAQFVADPFMIFAKNEWYMFFEVWNRRTEHGDIGLATSSDGLSWQYKQIVLDEPFHLSYPYVFQNGDDFYMTPETHLKRSIQLYRASEFPTRWTHVATLVDRVNLSDPCVFRYREMWWMFASPPANDQLHLFYAPDLFGPWREHPKSPVVRGDSRISRGGGRVLVLGDRVFRYAQDDHDSYGAGVRAIEVKVLTADAYSEEPAAIVLHSSGRGWNKAGMHTIDPHEIGPQKWLACVDGLTPRIVFGWKY